MTLASGWRDATPSSHTRAGAEIEDTPRVDLHGRLRHGVLQALVGGDLGRDKVGVGVGIEVELLAYSRMLRL